MLNNTLKDISIFTVETYGRTSLHFQFPNHYLLCTVRLYISNSRIIKKPEDIKNSGF